MFESLFDGFLCICSCCFLSFPAKIPSLGSSPEEQMSVYDRGGFWKTKKEIFGGAPFFAFGHLVVHEHGGGSRLCFFFFGFDDFTIVVNEFKWKMFFDV